MRDSKSKLELYKKYIKDKTNKVFDLIEHLPDSTHKAFILVNIMKLQNSINQLDEKDFPSSLKDRLNIL